MEAAIHGRPYLELIENVLTGSTTVMRSENIKGY